MKIGLITSGGDSPGMNPCIAELVKWSRASGHTAVGIQGGYPGVLQRAYLPLDACDIQPIYKQGGSVLKSGRLPELRDGAVAARLVQTLREDGFQCVFVLGGDGSFRGAQELARAAKGEIAFFGLPATIDNDVWGTRYTLGFDTAINKLAQYIDDIMDTAVTMPGRVFLIETLGRDGRLAYSAEQMGLVDFSVMSERDLSDDMVCERVRWLLTHGRDYVLITYSEGTAGRMFGAARQLEKELGCSVKCNMIGYQQRGGRPTAAERMFAAGFAKEAWRALMSGARSGYIVWDNGRFSLAPLADANKKKPFVPTPGTYDLSSVENTTCREGFLC